MPEATGTASASIIPIDLRGAATAAVRVPADVIAYFNIIPPTATTEEMVVRTRKAHTRASFNGLDDTAPDTIGVRASTWEAPVRAASGASGTLVKIPTELKTPSGNIRFTSLRFPNRATVGDISNFIFEKFALHKPTYFIHGGNRYAVLKKRDVGTEPVPDATPA